MWHFNICLKVLCVLQTATYVRSALNAGTKQGKLEQIKMNHCSKVLENVM